MGPLLVLALLVAAVSGQHDMIRTPEMAGTTVVESTVGAIESACIFKPNQEYLRRVAFVESADGEDDIAWLPGYNGGIWRVDEDFFLATQSADALAANSNYTARIADEFGIDWSSVTWEDLRAPLYSALGAMLYTYYNDANDFPPWEIEDQADYWVQNYRAGGSREEYIADSELLEPFCDDRLDLIFLIDESSSIGALNVPNIKTFMSEVVEALEISQDVTRVGIAKFGQILSLPETEIVQNLGDTTNAEDLLDLIELMRINGGNTPTHAGLELVREEMFQVDAGARPREDGVRRVLIVFTDGESDDQEATIEQAELNRAAGIYTYVVAVSGHEGVDDEELEAIASPPICRTILDVETFPELEHIRDALVGQICDTPVIIGPGCTTLRLPAGHQSCLVVVGDEGTTLTMTPIHEHTAFLESSQDFPTMIESEGNIRMELGIEHDYTVEPLDEDDSIDGARDFMYCAFVAEGITDLEICVNVTDINPCIPNPCNNRGDEDAGCTWTGIGQYECTCSVYEGRVCENYYPGNENTPFMLEEMPTVGHWKEVLEWECAVGWVGDKCNIADV